MTAETETVSSGPAAAAFSGWLDAFNADPATLAAFISARTSLADSDARIAIQRRHAPASLVRVEGATSDSVTAVIEDRWAQRWRLQLTVGLKPPFPITALTPTPVWPPETAPAQPMPWPRLRAALETTLADYVAKG